MRRSPSLLVALGAAVTELVLVAAAGNQWIVKHLVENARADELPRDHQLKAVLTDFSWRFTPVSHDRAIWLGGIIAAAGMVVVVFLVVLAFVGAMRPPRSFFAVLFGTWGLVLGLTQLAAIGRLAIAFSDLYEHSRDPQGLGRFWYPVFHGPSAESVLFGGVTGLLVAIVAAILASATNQTATRQDEGSGGPSGSGGSSGSGAPGAPAGSAGLSGGTGSAGWSKPARPAFGSAGAKASWPTPQERSRFPRPSDPPFGS